MMIEGSDSWSGRTLFGSADSLLNIWDFRRQYIAAVSLAEFGPKGHVTARACMACDSCSRGRLAVKLFFRRSVARIVETLVVRIKATAPRRTGTCKDGRRLDGLIYSRPASFPYGLRGVYAGCSRRSADTDAPHLDRRRMLSLLRSSHRFTTWKEPTSAPFCPRTLVAQSPSSRPLSAPCHISAPSPDSRARHCRFPSSALTHVE